MASSGDSRPPLPRMTGCGVWTGHRPYVGEPPRPHLSETGQACVWVWRDREGTPGSQLQLWLLASFQGTKINKPSRAGQALHGNFASSPALQLWEWDPTVACHQRNLVGIFKDFKDAALRGFWFTVKNYKTVPYILGLSIWYCWSQREKEQ